ncbi:MAG: 2-dehydropantoate 2-reductase [Syntrophobacteraceae bacterium]|nr:2-dehydropantoate 2-reductase [Desulfobacteraceae bacterium]
MKIAIMGTGGVGGYYGGLLARAGHDVTFIARGAHLEAIRQKGLQVRSVHGNFEVLSAKATDAPAEVGAVELVLFSTKTYHTDEAARAILPMVGPGTVVISLQNGVDAADRIGAVIGPDHLVGGATWLSAAIESPGVIGQYSQFRRVAVGEFDGSETPRVQAIAEVLKSMGATVEIVADITQVLWTKFVFISAVSAMGCLTRVTFGEYRSVPESRAVLADALREVASVGRARGVALDEDVVEKTLVFIDGSAPEIKPSMQRDLEAGRRTELESMIGIVVRAGEALRVPTPVMRMAYAMIKPGDLGAVR